MFFIAATAMPRFLLRHADADLLALLENTVPPVDLARVAIFSGSLAKFKQQAGEGHPVHVINKLRVSLHVVTNLRVSSSLSLLSVMNNLRVSFYFSLSFSLHVINKLCVSFSLSLFQSVALSPIARR